MSIVIIVLMLVAAAFLQDECPNPVQDCPNVCEGEQCDFVYVRSLVINAGDASLYNTSCI